MNKVHIIEWSDGSTEIVKEKAEIEGAQYFPRDAAPADINVEAILSGQLDIDDDWSQPTSTDSAQPPSAEYVVLTEPTPKVQPEPAPAFQQPTASPVEAPSPPHTMIVGHDPAVALQIFQELANQNNRLHDVAAQILSPEVAPVSWQMNPTMPPITPESSAPHYVQPAINHDAPIAPPYTPRIAPSSEVSRDASAARVSEQVSIAELPKEDDSRHAVVETQPEMDEIGHMSYVEKPRETMLRDITDDDDLAHGSFLETLGAKQYPDDLTTPAVITKTNEEQTLDDNEQQRFARFRRHPKRYLAAIAVTMAALTPVVLKVAQHPEDARTYIPGIGSKSVDFSDIFKGIDRCMPVDTIDTAGSGYVHWLYKDKNVIYDYNLNSSFLKAFPLNLANKFDAKICYPGADNGAITSHRSGKNIDITIDLGQTLLTGDFKSSDFAYATNARFDIAKLKEKNGTTTSMLSVKRAEAFNALVLPAKSQNNVNRLGAAATMNQINASCQNQLTTDAIRTLETTLSRRAEKHGLKTHYTIAGKLGPLANSYLNLNNIAPQVNTTDPANQVIAIPSAHIQAHNVNATCEIEK